MQRPFHAEKPQIVASPQWHARCTRGRPLSTHNSRRKRFSSVFLLSLFAFGARPALAGDEPVETPIDYQTERIEPALFPIIEGDSDVGLGLGLVTSFTRFNGGVEPYIWSFDFVGAANFKDGPRGVELTQGHVVTQLDVPNLAGGWLRMSPLFRYERTINSGWWGRGNASTGDRPAVVDGEEERFFQFLERNVDVRNIIRILVKKPYEFVVVPEIRYADPTTYPGSRLELDRTSVEPDGRPTVRGVRPTWSTTAHMGAIMDTRDNEFFPHRGVFNQFAVRATQSFPLNGDVRYLGASASIAGFVPIARAVFAARALVDVMGGKPPFYDLIAGGPFVLQDLPGGSNGIRGIPVGRYAGEIKAIGSVELRSMFFNFTLFSQHFRVGGSTFFDTGRVWDDWSFDSPRDGKRVGLKWGAGVGGYLLWGESTLLRIDIAYAREATDENPKLPLGFYFEEGAAF
jgi:hypothetical protein